MKTDVLVACVLAALLAASSSYPTVSNPPRWSWTSLGSMTFAHTGQSSPYTPADLQLLSKFSMVQFDKKQSIQTMPHASQEDRFIAAGRQVKNVDKDIQVLMYINGLINFPAGRLYNLTDPSLLLNDDSTTGAKIKLAGETVFNVTNPAMRKLIVDDALYGMKSRVFNGVFIDRANWAEKCSAPGWHQDFCAPLIPAQHQLFDELTAALGEGNITLAKETSMAPALDWQVANAAMTSDSFCSAYCHGCNTSVSPASLWTSADAQTCADSIGTIANMSARGQLTQSHAMGPFDGPYSVEAREFTIAAFLIGAGNLSYFSYANWANSCWELVGTKWWPEYDYPLGSPTGPPNTLLPGTRWKYFRNFSSGTTVYVDVATRVVDIKWSNTTRTLPSHL